VDRTLTEQGIDLYRQDFNIEPLVSGGPLTAPIAKARPKTSMSKVTSPTGRPEAAPSGLRIDSCASGGAAQRFGNLARAVPLLRSDYLSNPPANSVTTSPLRRGFRMKGAVYAVGHSELAFQLQTEIDAYEYRSNMCASLNLCYDVRKPDLDYALGARLFAQLRQIGPIISAILSLTPYTRDNAAWMAWQCAALDGQSGIVQAFRRPSSPVAQRTFLLRGLTPAAHYWVTDLDHPSEPRRMTGAT